MPVARLDVRDLEQVMRLWREAGAEMRPVMSRTLNWVGPRAQTQVQRSLAKQTGLPYGRVRQELKAYRATFTRLIFDISGRGRPISLREFAPRQRREGVSARPWGKRRTFPGTFLAPSSSGVPEVFKRVGKSRLPIEKLYGPSIPKEMVKGAVLQAFEETARQHLPSRLAHELQRAFKAKPQRRR